MYKRIILVPYKKGSKSCKALQDALRADRLKCYRKSSTSRFKTKISDLVVYWGGHNNIDDWNGQQLNRNRIRANNKLSCLRVLAEVGLSTVPWTTDSDVAKTWPLVVARATLTGHSGQGIHMWTPSNREEPVPIAPLYTQYIKKTYECRVHVFQGHVIDAQIKRKVIDYEGERNTAIRNIHTGWVYCREGFILPDTATNLSITAVNAVGLDFGAVDLIYNQHHKQFYILEINTAPGLEGTTLTNYKEAIKNAATY